MRKIEKMEPRENSHLNVSTATSSDTYLDIYKTLNYKMTKRRNVAHLSSEKKKSLNPANPKLLLLKKCGAGASIISIS